MMNLSLDDTIRQQQLTAIKNYVEANHSVNGAGVYDQSTADAMNAIEAPSYFVFKTSVAVDMIRDESLVWSEVLHSTNGLTALQQFGLNTILHNGDFNPSIRNNREGLALIFTNNHPQTRAAVLANSTKQATIAEKLLSSAGDGPGGGNGASQSSAAVLGDGAEGEITVQNLVEADSDG